MFHSTRFLRPKDYHSLYDSSDVFATLPYSRDKSSRDRWLQCTSDSNRFIQSISRKIGPVEYLRVLEAHKDNHHFPHLHLHLRFRDGCRIRESGIYLLDEPRAKLKSSWPHGLSDFQCPRHTGYFPIGYILKYLGKSSSTSSLWQRLLESRDNFKSYTPDPNVNPIWVPSGDNVWKLISKPTKQTIFFSSFRWKRIKLLSYSRGYVKTYSNTSDS